MSVTVHLVSNPNGKEALEFLKFPEALYKGSQYYVPRFIGEMKRILQRKHSFFEHSRGDFFIARQKDKVVGRIALLEPVKFNSYQNKRDARFYFFEAVEDLSVFSALFDTAEAWARERSLNRFIGPQGFSAFTGAGILIEGFERPASMTMMNYNFPYYKELIEKCGFIKYKDFYSPELITADFEMNEKIRRAAEISRKRNRFTLPDIKTKRELKSLGKEIGNLYNDSWQNFEEFCPHTQREMEEMIKDLYTVAEPELIKILRKEGKLAGFALTFPDLSKALIRGKGRLNPFTLLSLINEKKRADRYLINGLGVLPEYRQQGGIALLFLAIEETLRQRGAKSAEMVQIAETTDLMLGAMEKLGGRVCKVHRIYQKNLE